tara:strand:- start:299 stop:559 length:261 start_codon:yes stop_codon:yes gene_type:complete
MKKITISTVIIFTIVIANAQSKKQQIETLTYKLDSINSILVQAIDSNRELNTIKIALESKINIFKKVIDSKNYEIKSKDDTIESLR